MILPGHICTVCGGEDLIALAPGSDALTLGDLFAVTRAVPDQAWCREHWPTLRRVCAEVPA